MATGWDGIIAGYNTTIDFLTEQMVTHPDRGPDQSQYFVDHARGMLQAIPILRKNPMFADFQPPPYTSHDTLTFSTTDHTKRVEVWCNVAQETYGIRLIHDGQLVIETTAVLENIIETLQQYIERLR